MCIRDSVINNFIIREGGEREREREREREACFERVDNDKNVVADDIYRSPFIVMSFSFDSSMVWLIKFVFKIFV